MPRAPRNDFGGYLYGVTQIGCKTKPIFRTEEDYLDFVQVLKEATLKFEVKLLGFCVLPKHWHLLLGPRRDGDLKRCMAWIAGTHSMRWHLRPRRGGTGKLYDRRFRSFPVQDNERLLDVLSFIETHGSRTNPLADGQVWQWDSVRYRTCVESNYPDFLPTLPVAIPSDWGDKKIARLTELVYQQICNSVARGAPYGDPAWITRVVEKMHLQSTVRPRGRPRKDSVS